MDKRKTENGERIITAKQNHMDIFNLEIYHFDKNFLLKEKINKYKANIENFEWILNDVKIFEKMDQYLNSMF